MGILEDICVRVGQSYVPIKFVVVETGGDVRAPIILGQPFLSSSKAIIYADNTKICFTIKDRKVKFTFKNHIHHSPSHPQKVYLPKETKVTKKINKRRRKNRAWQPREESVKMINTLRSEYDHPPLHHSLPRRKIQVYRQSIVQLDKESSTTPSATLNRVST